MLNFCDILFYMSGKKVFAVIGILGAVIAGGVIFLQTGATEAYETEQVEADLGPEITTESFVVEEGDVFTKVADRMGYGFSEALEMVAASEEVYDLTKVRRGEEFRKIFEDGVFSHIEYDIDGNRMLILEEIEEGFVAREEVIEYKKELAIASFSIENSMFLSGVEAGLEEGLIIGIADVFAWTIDFATQVQVGDSVEVLYEKLYRDGEYVGTGKVLAASFTNKGERFEGYLFEDKNGVRKHFDAEGNSLVRQFLRAPLSYSRITSGFTYARFHPVLNRTTPHRAIDYAAPIGTPIFATADGTVTFAGWNSGGYGNFIKIRHNSIYGTNYAHLSKFAVSAGDFVEQGEVIGYVGSTGFSTGPHLHYEMTVNGQLVNPGEVDLPAGDPISEEERGEFEAQRDAYRAELGW